MAKFRVKIKKTVVNISGDVGENGEGVADLLKQAREDYKRITGTTTPARSTDDVEIILTEED